MAKASSPIVRHSNRALYGRKLASIFNAFSSNIAGALEAGALEGINPEADIQIAPTGDHLLNLRRRLRDAVKQGVLERKDMEKEIAILACLIWYHRQAIERQQALLDAW